MLTTFAEILSWLTDESQTIYCPMKSNKNRRCFRIMYSQQYARPILHKSTQLFVQARHAGYIHVRLQA